MGWIARGLLFLGGIIASWFIATDADNFHFISFVIAMLLFVALIVCITFWPVMSGWVKSLLDKDANRDQQP